MAVGDEYLQFLRDRLARVPDLRMRRMFGGAGLYGDGVFFAIVVDDTLYFKVDDKSRPAFEALGAQPFRYRSRGRVQTMDYYEVPADVIEEDDTLTAWARRAMDAGRRSRSAKTPAARR
jgi:DNA transformation protein